MRAKALSSILPTVFAFVIALMFLNATSSATVKVLHSFVPSPPGFGPTANLIQDAAGNLYGTTQSDGKYGLGSVFKLEPGVNGTWKKTYIYSFLGGDNDGSVPIGGVIFDAAGNLYGTTASGGNGTCGYGNACGTVFKLSPGQGGTWTESVLYDFQPPPDGAAPLGNLVMDASGDLYGVTQYGGNGPGGAGSGIVFELTPTSRGQWTETIIYTFQGGDDGGAPLAGLVFDPRGNLYGTTFRTVFELTPGRNGTWTHSVLYNFDNSTSAQSTLIFDSAGNLYGTAIGGPGVGCDGYGCGLVFKLAAASNGSWTYHMLYVFEGGPDGASPVAGLVFDPAGNLYGTTQYGGTPFSDCEYSGCGTVFELSPRSNGRWKERVIYRFAAGIVENGSEFSGVFPVASLIFDQAGNLYGTTPVGGSGRYWGGTVFKLSPKSNGLWTSKVLYDFGLHKDGAQPDAALVADSAGNLYGTNTIGGSGGGDGNNGGGTVFKVARSKNGWEESVIYNFTGGPDGSFSESRLMLDAAGNLYGTAYLGGMLCSSSYQECGTVFKLTPQAKGTWKETTLYQFAGGATDGANPISGLTFDAEGNLYGTTSQGGGCSGSEYGCGTVFELTPSGKNYIEKALYSFGGGSDGESPSIPLLLDNAGNLYGATDSTVFELTPNSGGGWTEAILYQLFDVTGLIFDAMGNLYGTTFYGGRNDGTVFELSPTANGTWTEKVLYKFKGTHGARPTGLVFDSAGLLYGTTNGGGSHDNGVIFSLAPGNGGSWTETVLHKFEGKNGRTPNGPLILDSNGNLFGTTLAGGVDDQGVSQGSGVVFEYSPSSQGSEDDSRVPDQHSDRDDQSSMNAHRSLSQPLGSRTTQKFAKEALAK